MKEEYVPLPPEKLALEQDQLVQKLSLLYEISQAMMTTIKLGDLLEIIMTEVTMGSGFGFNRAMLFLIDPGKETRGRGIYRGIYLLFIILEKECFLPRLFLVSFSIRLSLTI